MSDQTAHDDLEQEAVDTEFEAAEDTAAEEPKITDEEDTATDEEDEAARRAAHDQRIEGLANAFAALINKGQEVISSLESKTGAVSEGGEAYFADIDAFASSVQDHFDRVAEQFSHDLETFSKVVDEATTTTSVDQDEDEGTYTPRFTPEAAKLRERMGVSEESEIEEYDPEFVERFANFAFGDVPAAIDLDERTRFICWLATVIGCTGIDEYYVLLPAALNVGVEPEAIKEIVYQATAYLGLGRTYPFICATNEIFEYAGIELPLKRAATTEPIEESRYEGGSQAQCAAFGDHMAGFKDRGNPDYPWMNQFLVKNCFGDYYTRGGLEMRERELITFCFLAAQGGCENQLRAHTQGNLHCGNDREFLIKVVGNNVPFIGYPRSLNAMAIVEEVTKDQA